MVEQETLYVSSGHNFNKDQFLLEAYRLLCYFLASKPLHDKIIDDLAKDGNDERLLDGRHIFENLQKQFFTDEISRILLQLAIMTRVIDDEDEADREERYLPDCGLLWVDSGEPQTLDLREACNKIVHARKVNFDTDSGDFKLQDPVTWANPIVFLYGDNFGKPWRVKIELIAFVVGCTNKLSAPRSLMEYLYEEHKIKFFEHGKDTVES